VSTEEFRDDLRELLGRYPSLDAEDLRDIAGRLNRLADRREDEQEVL